jgi:uncharacterized membrane protein YeaQ/YmgE (transglycosylase-associated protein family)
MGIIMFVVFGLIVGLVARALMPGRQGMSLVMTAVLGIVGSFVGGFLVSVVTHNPVGDLNAAGILGSIIGALVVLFVVARFGPKSATA